MTDVEQSDLDEALVGKRVGTREWAPDGSPYVDGEGRNVSIWRPRDKPKSKKKGAKA